MAKTKVDEWDTVPANNADIDGISILGTAPASNMDNALRELMAQIRATPLRQDAADMRTALDAQTLDATLTSLSGLSLAAGDVLYATAADTLARLPKGTAAQVLAMNAGATAPEWSTSTAQASDATLTSLSGLSLVAGDMLYATAADTVTRLPKGTASQILVMNSGATAPEWTSAVGDSDTQVFSASGTWTKPAWATANSRVYVRMWGGGGGAAGGGIATGGSGAAYCEAWFLASDLSSTESVTVGAGGAGTTATADGVNGGDTTFKTFTASGGIGGDSSNVGVAGGAVKKSGATFIAGGAAGVLAEGWQGGGSESSGTGTGALKSIFGGAGGGSRNGTRTGGLSMFGGNGGAGSTSAGVNGSVPGGGGGAVGGDGGDGLAIITTFR